MMILIIASYSTDIMMVFNIGAIVAKHVTARFTYSPQKLQELWNPLPYAVGNSYAFCLVLFALGIIYGPIFPPAYLVCSIGLAIKWLCTRVAMRHWFADPPSVDQEMMMTLRWRLGQVICISLIVQCCAISQASGPDNLGPGLFMSIGGSIAVLAYTLTPLGVYFKELARFDQMADTDSTDTAGTTFEQASVDQGLPMPWYICPALADQSDAEFQKTCRMVSNLHETSGRMNLDNNRYAQAALAETAAWRCSEVLSQFGGEGDQSIMAKDVDTAQITLEEAKPRASIRSESPPPAVQELPIEIRKDYSGRL